MNTSIFDTWSFDNRFTRKLPQDTECGPGVRQVAQAWSAVLPTPVAAPRVLAVSEDVMAMLGLPVCAALDPAFAQVFSGNVQLPGMLPHSTNYGGHQFGHWAGQLGDGRAITLGEVGTPDGAHLELQLKGAGPTPYSRSADGRAVLRSSVREFICSEAMHHLGIPTTRALSLVQTGEPVLRDMFYDGHPQYEPGAVVCRVAPTFLRFGHFQLPASRGDIALLRALADFCIERDFPLHFHDGVPDYGAWFHDICVRTAEMVAGWMRVGFVHGVMNTDNMSVAGLTIDYGPYGFVDNYDPDFTPNTTDAQGRRYRFDWQPRIAFWNLQQLAGALSPLFEDTTTLQIGLETFVKRYGELERENTARKLGLDVCTDEDMQLMQDLHDWMYAHEVDRTIFFRTLGVAPAAELQTGHFDAAFYDETKRVSGEGELAAWLERYATRSAANESSEDERVEKLRLANPKYIPRNWLTQRAIEQAEAGDMSGIHALMEVIRRPYDEQPAGEGYAARRPDWAREKPGCAMLSCSS